MSEPEPIPKLRIVEDQDAPAEDVVRLGGLGQDTPRSSGAARQPAAPAPAPEPAARLESASREHFEGRSVEPGMEAILDRPESTENVESPWGGSGHRLSGIPYGWFLLLALLLAGAGFWSLRAMKKGEDKAEASRVVLQEKIEEDKQEDAEARVLVDAVEDRVRAYLAAETVEGLLPHVRHPERVRPLIEETWKTRPRPSRKFNRMTMFQPALLDGKPFWVVRAEVEGGEAENILLEQTGPAEVKIDWETHTGYQPMPWDRYATERPDSRSLDFRVWAQRDLHFSHEFSDSGKWRSFRLTAKDSVEHLFGYAEAGSETDRLLETYCAGAPRKTATVLLRLRFPPGSGSPRGVLIEKVVETRWVHVEDPSDAP